MVDKVSGDRNIEVWDELESELAKTVSLRKEHRTMQMLRVDCLDEGYGKESQ